MKRPRRKKGLREAPRGCSGSLLTPSLCILPSCSLRAARAACYPPFLSAGLDTLAAYAKTLSTGVRAKPPPPLVAAASVCGLHAVCAVGGAVCRVPLMPAAKLLAHLDALPPLALRPLATADARRQRLGEYIRSLLAPDAPTPAARTLWCQLPRLRAALARVGGAYAACAAEPGAAVVEAAAAAVRTLVRAVAHSLEVMLAGTLLALSGRLWWQAPPG